MFGHVCEIPQPLLGLRNHQLPYASTTWCKARQLNSSQQDKWRGRSHRSGPQVAAPARRASACAMNSLRRCGDWCAEPEDSASQPREMPQGMRSCM